jgi:hypothetical protein
MKDYSTRHISKKLLEEVIKALQNIRGWGSVEIFVQDSEVVQIVERNIKKTTSAFTGTRKAVDAPKNGA